MTSVQSSSSSQQQAKAKDNLAQKQSVYYEKAEVSPDDAI